ncbi:hypothetical protein D3C76_1222920 [compost metagenome]
MPVDPLEDRIQVGDQGRTRGDQDVADRHVAPVVLPGAQDRLHVVQSELAGVALQAFEHRRTVVQAMDPLQAPGQRQADGPGTAADIQQTARATKIHALDESFAVGAAQALAAHLPGPPVPGAGRLGLVRGAAHVLAVALGEIDVIQAHGHSPRSIRKTVAIGCESAAPAGRRARPGAPR